MTKQRLTNSAITSTCPAKVHFVESTSAEKSSHASKEVFMLGDVLSYTNRDYKRGYYYPYYDREYKGEHPSSYFSCAPVDKPKALKML